jgi:hypothetical protein
MWVMVVTHVRLAYEQLAGLFVRDSAVHPKGLELLAFGL